MDVDPDVEDVAEVVPLDPVVACMMRHPAGKRRDRDRDYPPIRESNLRLVSDGR